MVLVDVDAAVVSVPAPVSVLMVVLEVHHAKTDNKPIHICPNPHLLGREYY